MKLSTRAHYGLRALVAIAKLTKDGDPVSVHDIAEQEDLSDTYLEQLMSKLRRAGIVKSFRGARGGYELVKDVDSITVAELLDAAGEKLTFPDCVSAEGCDRAKARGCMCPSGFFWNDLSESMLKMAESVTVGDLIRREEKAFAELKKAEQD